MSEDLKAGKVEKLQVVKNRMEVRIRRLSIEAYPFLIRLLVCGTLLFFFPQIARFPPNVLMKKATAAARSPMPPLKFFGPPRQ